MPPLPSLHGMGVSLDRPWATCITLGLDHHHVSLRSHSSLGAVTIRFVLSWLAQTLYCYSVCDSAILLLL